MDNVISRNRKDEIIQLNNIAYITDDRNEQGGGRLFIYYSAMCDDGYMYIALKGKEAGLFLTVYNRIMRTVDVEAMDEQGS